MGGSGPRPAGRRLAHRRVAGALAACALVAVVAGGPVLLLRLGADPLPERATSLPEVVALLTGPDDGTMLLWALSVVGWVAWAVVACSLLLEVAAQLTGCRTLRVPGLAVPQRLAHVVVAGVLAALAVPGAGQAAVPHAGLPPGVTAVAGLGAGAGAAGTAGGTAAGEVPAGPGTLAYEVAEGDWMWHISGRYLGDERRYPEIAALNPGYAQRYAGFPDHIEPGDRLVLPEDAYDHGMRGHAAGGPVTGQASSAPDPGATQGAGPDRDAGPDRHSGPDPGSLPDPAPPAPAGSTPAIRPAAPAPFPPGRDAAPDVPPPAGARPGDPVAATPLLAAAAAAGALVVALVLHRRRGGRATAGAAAEAGGPGTQVVEAGRLDHALRALAAARGSGPAAGAGRFPDIGAVWISNGDIHLILASPDPDPPAPFRPAGPDSWVLPAGADLPDLAGVAAPLPALVTVGHRPGRQLLLDLERIGLLTVTGHPDRSRDLLRHMVAELAHNPWSEQVEVVLVGYPPEQADALAALAPGRVAVAATLTEAAAHRRRPDIAGVATAPEGRAGDLPGAGPVPRVLVAELAGGGAPVADLDTALAAGGLGAAVVRTGPDGPRGRRSIAVTGDGLLQVGFLDGLPAVPAVALPAHLLDRLSGLVRGGPVRTPGPVRCA